MKRNSLLLAVLFIGFALAPTAYAQTDPCALRAVVDSFRAAALSDSVDVWVAQYEGSVCSPRTLSGVRQLVRAVDTITGRRLLFEQAMYFDGIESPYIAI